MKLDLVKTTLIWALILCGLAAGGCRGAAGDPTLLPQATIPPQASSVPGTPRPEPSVVMPSPVPTRMPVGDETLPASGGDVGAEERPLTGVRRIVLSGHGEVIIAQGEPDSLMVETDPSLIPWVQATQSGETLALGLPAEIGDRTIAPDEVRFSVRVAEIDRLELAGAGTVQAGPLETGHLEIVTSGAGDIVIDSLTTDSLVILFSGAGGVEIGRLAAEDLALYLNGVGTVSLAGQAAKQSVFFGGKGDYLGADLESQECVVDAGGIGLARLWVTESLEVRISGPGTVEYYGEPQVTQEIGAMGRLVSLGSR